jgi:hypothetical protein
MTNNLEITKINAAVDLLIESDVDLSNALGKDGLIKQLSKRILERALEAEMDNHLRLSIQKFIQQLQMRKSCLQLYPRKACIL